MSKSVTEFKARLTTSNRAGGGRSQGCRCWLTRIVKRISWSWRITRLATLAVAAVLGLAHGQHGFGQDFEVRLSVETTPLYDWSCVAFSPDSRMLIVASNSWMRAWDLEKNKERVYLTKQGKKITWGIRSVAFSPNGDTLALGCFGAICLLDIAAGKETDMIVPGIKERTISVAFAKDSKTLTAAFPRAAISWDLVKRREKSKISDISYTAIAPDGNTLASCWPGHGVRIWHLDSGKECAFLEAEEISRAIWMLRSLLCTTCNVKGAKGLWKTC
jgi:WD40 repeat protein